MEYIENENEALPIPVIWDWQGCLFLLPLGLEGGILDTRTGRGNGRVSHSLNPPSIKLDMNVEGVGFMDYEYAILLLSAIVAIVKLLQYINK